MFLALITAVHVVDVAMDLIDVWSEGCTVLIRQLAVRVCILLHNVRLFIQSCVQIVNILSHKHRLHVLLLQTELLELSDCTVTFVDLLFFCKLDEIVVPLPYCHWILLEEISREKVHWVRLPEILLCIFPEAIVAPECWDTACRAYSSSCEHHNTLTSDHKLGCLLSCLDLWLFLVFFWTLKVPG